MGIARRIRCRRIKSDIARIEYAVSPCSSRECCGWPWRLYIFLSHRWSEGKTNQQPFRRQEPTNGLPPRLFLVLDEHSIAARFKLRSCTFHTVDVKLKKSLWHRDLVWPGISSKTGLRHLRKRPQGESLRAFHGLRMKIPPALLFEINPQALSVEPATLRRFADDGTKAGDEQNLDTFNLLHTRSRNRDESGS